MPFKALKTKQKKIKTVYDACKTNSNLPLAFISKEFTIFDFESITGTRINDFDAEYSGQSANNDKLNACIYLPLEAKLLVDLSDKQWHNNDISSIRKMIILLKFKNQVQDIYIDNLGPAEKVEKKINSNPCHSDEGGHERMRTGEAIT